jgi:hypothetical protein
MSREALIRAMTSAVTLALECRDAGEDMPPMLFVVFQSLLREQAALDKQQPSVI